MFKKQVDISGKQCHKQFISLCHRKQFKVMPKCVPLQGCTFPYHTLVYVLNNTLEENPLRLRNEFTICVKNELEETVLSTVEIESAFSYTVVRSCLYQVK